MPSQFHRIRRFLPLGFDEAYIIDVWLRSDNDPYMREKIVEHCSIVGKLQHITADYLDRIAKLKLFL
jgi:hypothetical protein